MPPSSPTPLSVDRRQNPRVLCGGLAKIISLPSEGLSVPGKVLNLSLSGCGIETVSPLPTGTRVEIMLRVNATSIRVLGEVRVHRGPHVVGVEFLLVSACGKYLLEDLIRELARQQAIANILKGTRRQSNYEMIHQMRPVLSTGDRLIAGSLVSLVETAARPLSTEPISSTASALSMKRSVILNGDELDVFI